MRGVSAMVDLGDGDPESPTEWDVDFGHIIEFDDALECVTELANGRPLLAFGVGSGRLVRELLARGVAVCAIEGQAQIERLKALSGTGIDLTVGDCITTTVEGKFAVVLMTGPGLFSIPTQSEQVECFANAARHLVERGRFVVEVVSAHSDWADDGRCWTIEISPERTVLLVKRYERLTQTVQSCYIDLYHGKPPSLRSSIGRYACPAEMDLMAEMAGMRLIERWSGWDRLPYHDNGRLLISVYEKV
jgi:hypothetical protein